MIRQLSHLKVHLLVSIFACPVSINDFEMMLFVGRRSLCQRCLVTADPDVDQGSARA
jgi:hypothetical protein